MCTVLMPPGGYPIAVNKYIIVSSYITDIFAHSHTKKRRLEQISFVLMTDLLPPTPSILL